MKKLLFGILLLILSGIVIAQEQQFKCNFLSEVKIITLDVKNPKSVTQKIEEKFTFIIDKDGSASYINLSHGVLTKLHVNYEGSRLVFTEKNNSDNYFVMTIFINKKEVVGMPALYSFNSWNKDNSFFYPSIKLGYCI